MTTDLVLGTAKVSVSTRQLINASDLFLGDLTLAMSPYQVRSAVSLSALHIFIEAIEGRPITLTSDNSAPLAELSAEFGFKSFSATIAAFAHSPESRIAALEARVAQQADENEALRRQLTNLASEVGRLSSECAAMRALAAAAAPPRAMLESVIVRDLPGFDEFRDRPPTLLWRGTRDGFGAKDFHDRCDGHGPTVTIVQTTEGWVFGGYTPLRWGVEPPVDDDDGSDREDEYDDDDMIGEYSKSDTEGRTFVFTIKNPHDAQARKFALKPDRCDCAISSHPEWGPTFGAGDDLYVCDRCNEQRFSYTGGFGDVYANDTGLDGKAFFTGEGNFVVQEIEVFEFPE
jgi:uncharacterized coiled-coil protein SlyX